MIALSLLAAAFAADDEISVEAGWIGAHDRAWDVFSGADSYGTIGLRVGKSVHERVAVVLGWQHGNTGGDVWWYGEEELMAEDQFRAAFYGDQLSLGAKADLALLPWLHPYVTVQGVGARAMVRFDDDADDDENVAQVQRVGLSGGGYAAAGIETPIRVKGDFAIAPHVELGYGLIAPISFGDVGRLSFGGFAGRGGLGVRF